MSAMGDKTSDSRRMARERRTVEAMIALYCRRTHGSRGALCADCRELFDYALARLDRCPLAPNKPTCARCPVHCYRRDMRERIIAVMRATRAAMLLHHPLLTILHMRDTFVRPRER
jgi:hypothetical protein